MLTAYIVDDEPIARQELKYLLQRTREVEVVGESDEFNEAYNEIKNLKPEIVFLDIELAEENGLTLAEQLQQLTPAPFIVFATAYDEYALQAFDVNAIDYMLKPFDEARVQKVLEKMKNIQQIGIKKSVSPRVMRTERTGKIAVMTEEKIMLIQETDILSLEAMDGKCMIRTMQQEWKVSDTLIALEKKLDPTKFLRVHRSFIVNLDFVIEIEPWFNSTFHLHMKDQSKIPVSRTYVKELKQIIGF